MASIDKTATEPVAEDIYFLDPCAVHLDAGAEGREGLDAEILEMAISLHVHGQRRAVECRRGDGDRLRLVHGFIRTAAARLIRSGFQYINPETGEEIKVKDRTFKLKVVLVSVGK